MELRHPLPLRRVLRWSLALCLAFWCLARPGRSYVTSALLEYMGDDKCGFWLNGKTLLSASDSEIMYFWWGALSTSDGTLPLELFNNNGDNLLAAANYDLFGGSMYMAYRLTVHHSNGDPVVVWGEPNKTKFFNVPRNTPFPPNWFAPGFDDSTWGTAVQMTAGLAQGIIHLCPMEDAAFGGWLGQKGYVPFLCHNSNSQTNPRDTDLYRNHFSFPNSIGKATLIMNPAKAVSGQQVAFRLVPSRDAADFATYQAYVSLPPSLKPGQILNNGVFDPKTRRINWTLANPSDAGSYIKMAAESILDPGGWQQPERALGGYKSALRTDAINVPDSVLNNAASFLPNQAAWFKMSSPGAAGGENTAILGVIFKAQLRVGGKDTAERKGANQVFLNYSIDGGPHPALGQDVQLSHACDDGSDGIKTSPRWTDGYYDASEDRKWTWNDISNLRVRVQSRQFASRQTDYMASLRCTVRVFRPTSVSPAFMAQVMDGACTTLDIKAGVEEAKSGLKSMDSYPLPINVGRCPTSTPTKVPTPMPTPLPGHPPLPTPTPIRLAVDLGLGCLSNSPEPFKRGGTFIYFCLKRPADITIKIFGQQGQVRILSLGHFRAGNNQVFYNALDDKGRPIPPGSYTYEVTAQVEDKESQNKNSQFTRAADSGSR